MRSRRARTLVFRFVVCCIKNIFHNIMLDLVQVHISFLVVAAAVFHSKGVILLLLVYCYFWSNCMCGFVFAKTNKNLQHEIGNTFLPIILACVSWDGTHYICFDWEIRKIFFCYTLFKKACIWTYFNNHLYSVLSSCAVISQSCVESILALFCGVILGVFSN